MLIYRGFIGQIDYDNERQLLVGEVINSYDVLEFHGASAVEIKQDFQSRIDEYLSFQKNQIGLTPVPFVANFTICLATDKQNKVIEAAHSQGQSVNHWLNQQVDSHLTHYFNGYN